MAVKTPTAVRRYMAEIGRRGGKSKTISAEDRRANARRAALERRRRARPASIAADKPIWKIAAELLAQIPDADFRKLPTDGARQLDHCLYPAFTRRA